MPRKVKLIVRESVPDKLPVERVDWDPVKKKRKRAPTAASRRLELWEVQLISLWLFKGIDYTKKGGKLKEKEEWIKWRDLALFWLILTTGFRVSEALSVKIEQVTYNGRLRDTLQISGKHLKRSGHTLQATAAKKKAKTDRLAEEEAKQKAAAAKPIEPIAAPAAAPAPVYPPEVQMMIAALGLSPVQLQAFLDMHLKKQAEAYEAKLAAEKARADEAEKKQQEEAKKKKEEDEKVRASELFQQTQKDLVAAQARLALLDEQKREAEEKKKNKAPPPARTAALREDLMHQLLQPIVVGRKDEDYLFRSGCGGERPLTSQGFLKILKRAAYFAFRDHAKEQGKTEAQQREYAETKSRNVGTNSLRKTFLEAAMVYYDRDNFRADQLLHGSRNQRMKLAVREHYSEDMQRRILNQEQIILGMRGLVFPSPFQQRPVAMQH